MADENTQTENIPESGKKELAFTTNKKMASKEPSLEDERVYDLNDTREYLNQRDILKQISQLYQHLNPSYKKIVRLTITRNA